MTVFYFALETSMAFLQSMLLFNLRVFFVLQSGFLFYFIKYSWYMMEMWPMAIYLLVWSV